MSDEEDYMSDKFLQEVQKYVAPSLIFRPEDKREMELLKKKAEIEAKLKDRKPTHVVEEEKREEGLSSAISSNNKGFEMLVKMGYNPGKGLGKKESGISEPIGVDLKTNRLGIGKEKPVKKIRKVKNPLEKLEKLDTADFRNRLARKKSEQVISMDLRKSQKTCELLDVKNKIEEPHETWFWFPKEKEGREFEESDSSEEDEEDEDEEELNDSEKLEILTKYLREKYLYCIWCGVAYDNQDDLRESCPGSTRNDH